MARTPTPVRSLAGVAAAGLLLTGCGLGDVLSGDDGEPEATADPVEETDDEDEVPEPTEEPDAEPAPDPDPEDEPAEDDAEDAADDDGDGDGDDGSAEAESDEGRESPFEVRTGTVDLEETESFDSGVQVAVTKLTVEAMAIFVDIEVLNGYEDEVQLAWWDPELEDNTGRSYPYVAPEENVELTVPSGGSLSATIAFRGALNPNARTVTFDLNRTSSGDTRPSPTFRDLPLPEDD